MSRGARKAAVSLALVAVGLGGGVAFADPTHPRFVSTVPVSNTPAISDGMVYSVAQVGSITIVGGTFTAAASPGGTAIPRNKLLAYDTATGALLPNFVPGIDGDVYSVVPGPQAGTVYVGGQFTNAGGIVTRRVALLNASTGAAVPGFKSPGFDGIVRDLEVVGGRLFVAGQFATAGGVAHAGLASLNATTGAVDPYVNLQMSEHHNNTGVGAQAPIGALSMDVRPDGAEMVVVGNFRKIDGQPRVQAAKISLGATAQLTDWSTPAYEPLCAYGSVDTYMREVSYDPTGTYFVIGTTGAGYPGTLCDTVARWESAQTGSVTNPTWSAYTGGDTVLSTAVSGPAIYVGGHMRWFNNPGGRDFAAAGAVPRPGIAALDPDSGLPLSWNPGRNPRGYGATYMGVTPTGLFVGSDTDYLGNYKYKRLKLGFLPLDGGAQPADETQLGLPGQMYVAGRSGSSTGLSVSDFTGTSASPTGDINALGLDWSHVRGAFYAGGRLFYGYDTSTMYVRSYDGNTLGPATEIDPYNDPAWSSVDTGSGQTYRGVRPDFYGQLPSVTGLAYAGDRIYYTLAGHDSLFWRWFNLDSGIVGATQNTLAGGFAGTQGLTYASGKLWQVNASGSVIGRTINGLTLGAPETVSTGADWRGTALFVAPVSATPPTNPLTAAASVTCTGLNCTATADGAGNPADATYSWDFGDNTAVVKGATVSHSYAAAGQYTVRLTVTDTAGQSATTTQVVTAGGTTPGRNVEFVDATTASGSASSLSVAAPAQAAASDVQVMVGTYASGVASPKTPAGWTLSGSRSTIGLRSFVWTRRLAAGDLGSAITVKSNSSASATLVVSTYRNVAATSPVKRIASAATFASPMSPVIYSVGATSRVVEAFSGVSSRTIDWSVPAGTDPRGEVSVTSGSSRAGSLVVDSSTTTGRAGGHRASASGLNAGIGWSIELRK